MAPLWEGLVVIQSICIKTALAGTFALVVGAAAGNAHGTTIAVKNSGFELPTVADGGFIAAITDWTVGSDSGVGNQTNAQYTNTTGDTSPIPGGDGFQVGYAQNNSFLYQDIDATLNPGGLNLLQAGEYTLTVAVGNRLDIGIGSTYNVAMGPYTIKLMVGTTVLATATGSSDLFTDGQFTDVVLNYTASGSDPNLGQQLRIRLESTGTDVGSQANYDNARLSLLVPEPATAALVLGGGLLALRRRTR